jgi:hypothetical protein
MKATDSQKLDKLLKKQDRLAKSQGEILATLADVVSVFGKRFYHVDEQLTATEKRLGDRISGAIVKVDGVQNTLDREADVRADQKLPDRVADLETDVFGKSRAPRPVATP